MCTDLDLIDRQAISEMPQRAEEGFGRGERRLWFWFCGVFFQKKLFTILILWFGESIEQQGNKQEGEEALPRPSSVCDFERTKTKMAPRAWYMDDKDGDQRLPHMAEGADSQVSGDMLIDLGVLYWKLDADKFENDPDLEKIRSDRGYDYQDIVTVSPDKLPNYETKVRRRGARLCQGKSPNDALLLVLLLPLIPLISPDAYLCSSKTFTRSTFTPLRKSDMSSRVRGTLM